MALCDCMSAGSFAMVAVDGSRPMLAEFEKRLAASGRTGDVRPLWGVNISKTTSPEQRRTDWIDTQSLADFLDPDDPDKTVEGYPAPLRAMVLATALPG